MSSIFTLRLKTQWGHVNITQTDRDPWLFAYVFCDLYTTRLIPVTPIPARNDICDTTGVIHVDSTNMGYTALVDGVSTFGRDNVKRIAEIGTLELLVDVLKDPAVRPASHALRTFNMTLNCTKGQPAVSYLHGDVPCRWNHSAMLEDYRDSPEYCGRRTHDNILYMGVGQIFKHSNSPLRNTTIAIIFRKRVADVQCRVTLPTSRSVSKPA